MSGATPASFINARQSLSTALSKSVKGSNSDASTRPLPVAPSCSATAAVYPEVSPDDLHVEALGLAELHHRHVVEVVGLHDGCVAAVALEARA